MCTKNSLVLDGPNPVNQHCSYLSELKFKLHYHTYMWYAAWDQWILQQHIACLWDTITPCKNEWEITIKGIWVKVWIRSRNPENNTHNKFIATCTVAYLTKELSCKFWLGFNGTVHSYRAPIWNWIIIPHEGNSSMCQLSLVNQAALTQNTTSKQIHFKAPAVHLCSNYSSYQIAWTPHICKTAEQRY